MKTGLCTGPSHAEPVYLPLDNEYWYFHKSGASKGKPLTPCRACANWNKLVKKDGPHGLVTIGRPQFQLVAELLDRCGNAEAAGRKYGLRAETLRTLGRAREPVRVQKRTIQRILLALAEQRRHDRVNGGTSERYRSRRMREAVRDRLIAEAALR